jgi:hypothetical protein
MRKEAAFPNVLFGKIKLLPEVQAIYDLLDINLVRQVIY